MNVLVDHGLFMAGLPLNSGHARIWANIFQRLPSDIEVYACGRIRNLPKPMPKALRGSFLPVIRPFRFAGPVLHWTAGVIDKLVKLHLLAPSLYTATESTLRLARRIPLVTILDDLTPEKVSGVMPEWVKPKRRMMEAAAVIICISESTRSLAIEHYKLPPERFRVAPLACDLVRPDSLSIADGAEAPYFLVVGNRQGHKNFDLTLQAFAQVARKSKEVSLLLAGPALAGFEIERIRELNLQGRIISAGRVGDKALAALYARSLALVYVSLSEGFGIPPLEAMTCGTVPIVSDCTSMPEVVGDAGLLIDPNDRESLVEAMLRVLEAPGLREELIARGLERARLFSWEKTAGLIFAAWRDAANVRDI